MSPKFQRFVHRAAVLAAMLVPALAHAQTCTLYVATNGNDSNPGTISKPWRHIQKAATSATPGSTVCIRNGVYNEQVDVRVSGSATAGYITFQSFPGEHAIVDGKGIDSTSNDGFPVGLFQIKNRSYIAVQNLEVRNFTGKNDGSTFPAGIYVGITGIHIQVLNNTVHNINGSPNHTQGAHGIAAYGTSAHASINNLTVSGNQVYNNHLGQSESTVFNGNVRYWTFTNNIVHDNDNIGFDAIGYEPTAPLHAKCGADLCDRARDGYVGENLIYNISDNNNPAYPPNDNSANGIYVDGGLRIVIERNIMHDCNIGIEITSENPGAQHPGVERASYVIARSNLIYHSTSAGASVGGYSSKGPGSGTTDHTIIVNNTLFENDTQLTGSGEFQIQFFPNDGTVSGNLFENNILYTTDQGLIVNNPFPNPIVKLGYNLEFAPDGNPTWFWENSHTYSDFATWKAASGDAHSIYTDPQFVNPGGSPPDLHVHPSSPAVNAGDNLGPKIVGTEDLDGKPRVQGRKIDIGAYEH
jgi:hypothetical protein